MVLSCSKGSCINFAEALQSLQGAEELCAYLTNQVSLTGFKNSKFFSLDLQLISQNVYRIKLRKKNLGIDFLKLRWKKKSKWQFVSFLQDKWIAGRWETSSYLLLEGIQFLVFHFLPSSLNTMATKLTITMASQENLLHLLPNFQSPQLENFYRLCLCWVSQVMNNTPVARRCKGSMRSFMRNPGHPRTAGDAVCLGLLWSQSRPPPAVPAALLKTELFSNVNMLITPCWKFLTQDSVGQREGRNMI